MKSILLLPFALLLLALMASCKEGSDNSQANVDLIEQYIAAVEAVDVNAMQAVLHDNYIGLGPSYGDTIRKEAALANWQNNIDNLYESINYNRSRNIAVHITSGDNQGDWVSNWAELEITYKDGRGTVTIWTNSIYQIENNQIVKSYTFYNEADALRQLGYVFIHPNDL